MCQPDVSMCQAHVSMCQPHVSVCQPKNYIKIFFKIQAWTYKWKILCKSERTKQPQKVLFSRQTASYHPVSVSRINQILKRVVYKTAIIYITMFLRTESLHVTKSFFNPLILFLDIKKLTFFYCRTEYFIFALIFLHTTSFLTTGSAQPKLG